MRIFLRGTIDELIDQLIQIINEHGDNVQAIKTALWERL